MLVPMIIIVVVVIIVVIIIIITTIHAFRTSCLTRCRSLSLTIPSSYLCAMRAGRVDVMQSPPNTRTPPPNPSLSISPPLPHSHPPYPHLQLHQHHFGGVPFAFCNWYACTDGFSGNYGVSGCSRGADDDDGNDDDNYDEFHHETDGFVLKEANLWWVKVLSEFNSGR